jgi:hypothetical protein
MKQLIIIFRMIQVMINIVLNKRTVRIRNAQSLAKG